MNKIFLPFLFCLVSFSVSAQFHYQGEKGLLFSYFPDQLVDAEDFGLGVGYQFFLSRRMQIEVNAAYHSASASYEYDQLPYRARVDVDQNDYLLRESINYSLFRLFRHLYFNVGVGLTQRYRQVSDMVFSDIQLDTLNLGGEEPEDFDPLTYSVEEKFRFGGHAQLLAELYLSRRLTLFARYRVDFYIKSREDQIVSQPSVGLRINF